MAEHRYKPISDYAMLGDGHTALLVAEDGSIDWCCWPNFDSGAVFCRLLDAGKGGWFRLGAAPGRHESSRAYIDDTNVLTTTVRTDRGTFRVTEFMPVEQRDGRQRGKDLAPSHRVLALVEGLAGTSEVEIEFNPTFDFARAHTAISPHRHGAVARASGEFVSVSCPLALEMHDSGCARGVLEIREHDRVWVTLAYGEDPQAAHAAAARAESDLKQTLKYWRDWMGGCRYEGPYADLVRRSALALKLMIFSPTGALVAAPTTSLPEDIGGVRNWDYRYTWLRDSSLILHSLETIGYYDEAVNFFEWLEALDLRNRGKFQIMYTIEGEAELPEYELDHLDGYRGSRPVRVGNAASTHAQVDIYGEVLEAAFLCFRRLKRKFRSEVWKMLSHLADEAARHWREPDHSIWEIRGHPRPFLYSKLLCWVALDRALRLAENMKLEANTGHWRAAREEIRDAILKRGYNREVGAFTQAFGSKDLDASALAVQRLGFLPPEDPRVISTTDQILKHLTRNGLVYRYRNDDSLPGREGAFTLCGMWMVDNLAGQGRIDEARGMFEAAVRHASDLGLLSEEIDPSSGELLGNYPQGFTHLGLIRAAARIGQAEEGAQRTGQHAAD